MLRAVLDRSLLVHSSVTRQALLAQVCADFNSLRRSLLICCLVNVLPCHSISANTTTNALTQLTCQQAWQAVHEARKHYCHHDAELQQQQLAIAIGCLLKPDKLCTPSGQEVVQELCAPSVLDMCLGVQSLHLPLVTFHEAA